MAIEQKKEELSIRLWLNGCEREVRVEPRQTLLGMLRDQFGLTGTKQSCDMEICGACTVLLDGRPVSSCSTLAIAARDKKIVTIEGLMQNGRLDPIQEAFIEKGALQCGFCTPGMILTVKALLDENPDPSKEEIAHYMDGNLCRCTGYEMIIDAIKLAASKRKADGKAPAKQAKNEG
jgi:aerobic carbon-monoxide dehydrogenase small subunit